MRQTRRDAYVAIGERRAERPFGKSHGGKRRLTSLSTLSVSDGPSASRAFGGENGGVDDLENRSVRGGSGTPMTRDPC